MIIIAKKEEIKIGGCYLHFKGNVYTVIAVGKHTETGEEMVVYCLTKNPNGGTFIRPLNMFCSDVDREKYPDVKQKERFKYLGLSQWIGAYGWTT